jgi:hypothetical protein
LSHPSHTIENSNKIASKIVVKIVVKNIDIKPTKPRPKPRALAFPKPRPGQKPTQAKVLARPGPAFFGPAWPGFWLQAGAGQSLMAIQASCKKTDSDRPNATIMAASNGTEHLPPGDVRLLTIEGLGIFQRVM